MADLWDQVEADTATARARNAGIAAPKVAPDAMGRAMQVADKRGLPPTVVADNLADYDEQEHLDALDGAAQASGPLGYWLSNPEQSALAKDDVGVLTRIGGLFTSGLLSQSKVMPGLALPRSVLDVAMADVRKQEAIEAGPVARAEPAPSWFSESVAKAQAGWYQGRQATATRLGDFGPAVMDPSTGQWTNDRTAEIGALAADQGRRAEAVDRTSASTEAGLKEIQAAQGWGQSANAIRRNPRAVMSVVAQSLGATAPNLAISAAMPASKMVQAITAGTGSFSAEQGFTVLDVMADAGVDTSDPTSVTAFLRNKPAMEAARQKGLERGVAIGAFDALTAGFAGRLLANARRSALSVTTRVAGEGLAQAAGGAAGETSAQLVSEGKITSQSDILLEAAAEVPTFLAEGRGQIAEARRNAANNADKFDALGEQKSVSRLVDLAGQSKTKARSAARFQSLIQDMTDEGNDSIYLPAEAVQKLFQSATEDGGPLAALVDPVELREALATGSEVRIPLAQYVTAVTPEQHQSIADAVRLQPGTRHDLEAVSSEDIQAAIEAGLAEGRATDERENGPAGQVYDEIYGQLLAKQDEKLARQSASVVQAVYRNLAERSGMDAWALFQQFRINIPGAKVDTRGQKRGVDIEVDPYLDAIRSGKLPTDQEIYGDSLATSLFKAGGLRDSGGELANMDAAKSRPGLVNNLAGMTFDDALVWAHQEGFITEAPTQLREEFDGDAPDINTLLDMLAQDLGGNPVYRAGSMNAERASFRDNANALAEELDAAGIDLQKLDNKAARAALGPTYNQAAYHGTPHAVDRFSLQKIGTGEGNQAFGWGLYFASQREIAEKYRSTLSEDDGFRIGGRPVSATINEWDAANEVGKARGDVDKVLNTYRGKKRLGDNSAKLQEKIDFLVRMKRRGAKYVVGGNTYQVDVPDDGDLLDYDKPMHDQPAKVQAAVMAMPGVSEMATKLAAEDDALLSELLGDDAPKGGEGNVPAMSGREMYAWLSKKHGSERAASEALLAAGIPGLRYADGMTRGKDGEQSHNYVIWDENAISEPRTLYQSPIPEAGEAEQLRAKVAEQEATINALNAELRTDQLTGLRNRRAFNEDESLGWEGVMAFDMDGLTALNKLGHAVGDSALQAIGNIMLASETPTARFYHTSGDEFYGRASTMEEADALAQMIQDKLESVDLNVDVSGEDGTVRSLTYKGIGISRGTGATPNDADQQAIANKSEREASGIRQAKGDNAPVRRLIERSGGDRREGGNSEPRRAADQAEDGRTLSQSAQTDTPEFHAWFGDSKVVDADGKPLVVYHGTSADFDTFEPRGKFGGAYFASQDVEYANAMASGDGGNVMPLYVSLKNPLVIPYSQYNADALETAWVDNRDGLIAVDDQGVKKVVVAFSPAQIKSATGNSGAFDPNNPSILAQSGEKAPRGSVSFGRDTSGRVFNIELLSGMDASTFMHEMGHVYLEVINDMAAREGAPAQLTADIATLDAWLKHEPGAAFTVDQHEQFARGFEAYLREGTAPTPALRRAFAAFKVWLTNIYRSVTSLNVDLTDDVRAVMDRIIASDAEIEEARSEQGHTALFRHGETLGMTPEQAESYWAAVDAARADAEAVVAADTLDALRREQKAWWHQEKRKLRGEVLAEMREQPIYRAQRILRNGRMPDGTDVPDVLRVKLDKEDLLDRYGQSFLRNLAGMYRVEGGVSPDEVANLLGFGSGKELIDGLVNAAPLQEAVSAETDARMAVRHPDPMTDGTLPDRAMVAAHRDKQAAVMVQEIRVLEAHVNGRARAQGAVIKGVAQRIIGEKKLRNLQPATYKAAEAKAGKEAFQAAAKQEWDAALAARRRQLLNFELFREAVRRRNEAAATAKYLSKFITGKERARLGKVGGSYLDQVDGLLDRFDFHKLSDKAADRRASLAAWIAEQSARGVDLNLTERMLDETFRVPFREMTVDDLRALRDAVKSIDHLARLKGKLILAGHIRDAAEVDEAMASSLSKNWKARPITTGDKPVREKVRRAFQQGRVLQGTATDIARELDGFVDRGAVWENTVGVIREAVNNQVNPRLKQAQTDLADIYLKHYTKAEIRSFGDLSPMAEVNGDLWSKRRLLALALNWGNEGNREAILTQAKARLSAEQAGTLLGRLDARDWAFVVDMWGLIESQWPDIAAAQKRRTGLVPERVTPTPFPVTTSDGRTLSIPGGYYPLKYEADSVKTMKEEADDFYNSIRTGRTAKASTKNGHTIERVGSGGRTVNLDTSVISQHLRDVIRDVHLGDAVNYVHNVLNGQQFREAVDTAGVTEYQRALEVWLKDAASGEIGPRVWHERAMRAARTNFTASVLTFKVTSAALQVTGIIPTTVVVGRKNMWDGLSQYLSRPRAMTKYIQESSPFMQQRAGTVVESVQNVMGAESGRYEEGRSAVIRWGFWMISRVQQQVDSISWLAGEAAGMKKFGGDIDKARAYADDVVARAQSSSEFIDKNPFQRGTLSDNVRQTEYIRATTALLSYTIAKGNLAYEATRKTNFKSPAQAARWAMDMAMLYSIEGIIAAIVTGKLPDDEDDDGIWDDLGEWAWKDALAALVGSLPGGGTVVTKMRGYDSGGVLANAWKAVADFKTHAEKDELDRGVIKAAVKVGGVATGLPSSQVNKTIDAVSAKADGSDVSPLEYLTGTKKK